jgi:hypothetical protein
MFFFRKIISSTSSKYSVGSVSEKCHRIVTSIKYHVTSANLWGERRESVMGWEKCHGDDTPLAQFSRLQTNYHCYWTLKEICFFKKRWTVLYWGHVDQLELFCLINLPRSTLAWHFDWTSCWRLGAHAKLQSTQPNMSIMLPINQSINRKHKTYCWHLSGPTHESTRACK